MITFSAVALLVCVLLLLGFEVLSLRSKVRELVARSNEKIETLTDLRMEFESLVLPSIRKEIEAIFLEHHVAMRKKMEEMTAPDWQAKEHIKALITEQMVHEGHLKPRVERLEVILDRIDRVYREHRTQLSMSGGNPFSQLSQAQLFQQGARNYLNRILP